ncbi:hypothetical protein [Collimonas arenae]|uniref:hypothetical protein n=1 Tax=Collimonas arenae TaxID=279058 RepID=UPI00056EBA5E|nr:hypothetical protein [Collimonas arenae]
MEIYFEKAIKLLEIFFYGWPILLFLFLIIFLNKLNIYTLEYIFINAIWWTLITIGILGIAIFIFAFFTIPRDGVSFIVFFGTLMFDGPLLLLTLLTFFLKPKK